MKCDIELIKLLLEHIEDHYHGLAANQPITISSNLKLQKYLEQSPLANSFDHGVLLHYHINLLVEAKLIWAVPLNEPLPHYLLSQYYPVRLTWEGHEFLAGTRDPENWQNVKDAVEKSGVVSFEVVKSILIYYGIHKAKKLLSGS